MAALLLAAGLPMLITGVRAAMHAYNRDELVTSGVFSLVRHPIYSAWIVLILPAVAVSRSWPFLLMPVAAYLAFKLSIHREDEYLRERFGVEYLEYRSQVSELLPFPRFRRK